MAGAAAVAGPSSSHGSQAGTAGYFVPDVLKCTSHSDNCGDVMSTDSTVTASIIIEEEQHGGENEHIYQGPSRNYGGTNGGGDANNTTTSNGRSGGDHYQNYSPVEVRNIDSIYIVF